MTLTCSYWEEKYFLNESDVLIIGAGITGLQCAIALKIQRPEWQIVVADRYPFPRGASVRNAGFACIGSMTEILDDMQSMSEDQVWSTVQKRWKGLELLISKSGKAAIDFQSVGGYEIFTANDQFNYLRCVDHLHEFNNNMYEITGIRNVFELANHHIGEMAFSNIRYMIKNTVEGQLNPGKMMKELLRKAQMLGIRTWFGVNVEKWVKVDQKLNVTVDKGWVCTFNAIVVATNGFTRKLIPHIDITPARNQVLVSRPIPSLPLSGTFHYNRGYVYFRMIDQRLLIGGGRNLAIEEEQTEEDGLNEKILSYLKSFSQTHIVPYEQLEWEYSWSGILGVGQKTPLLEWIEPGVLLCARLGGMGIAIGTQLGMDAARKIEQYLS